MRIVGLVGTVTTCIAVYITSSCDLCFFSSSSLFSSIQRRCCGRDRRFIENLCHTKHNQYVHTYIRIIIRCSLNFSAFYRLIYQSIASKNSLPDSHSNDGLFLLRQVGSNAAHNCNKRSRFNRHLDVDKQKHSMQQHIIPPSRVPCTLKKELKKKKQMDCNASHRMPDRCGKNKKRN